MDYAQTLLGFLPGGSRRTPGLKELLSAASAYLPEDQVERIRAAAEFGADAHRGQKRKTGEPYIAHPVAAASGTGADADPSATARTAFAAAATSAAAAAKQIHCSGSGSSSGSSSR